MKKSTRKQILTIIIMLAFLGSSITYAFISAFPSANQVQANWAAQLVITIFNEQQIIPADIGFTNETKASLFTINSDGIIYKTGTENATLGSFFKTWGQNFNSTCVLDYCNNQNNTMMMFLRSGNSWIANSEYGNYVIKNGDVIWIDYR